MERKVDIVQMILIYELLNVKNTEHLFYFIVKYVS
jgi:hypothetical protein